MTKSTLRKLTALILFILILPIIHNSGFIKPYSINYNKNDKPTNLIKPQASNSTIFINGTARGVDAHNWTWACSQEWCSGNGTWSDPFIIEKIYLRRAYIHIINSESYFIIRYCSITLAGIKISNSSNGVLFSNSLQVNGNQIGINILKSDNFNISNNNILNTNPCGIKLNITSNSTISRNTIIETDEYGIYCENCLYLNLVNNTILDAEEYGIYCENGLYLNLVGNILKTVDYFDSGYLIYVHEYISFLNVSYSKIIENILDFWDGYDNIVLHASSYNLIHNNSVLSPVAYSRLHLFESSFNNITNNLFQGESPGIILIMGSCSNIISHNNISHIHDGITLYSESNYNLIIMNQINYNMNYDTIDGNGIKVLNSNHNNILSNKIQNSQFGIELSESNYNVIKYNEILEYTLDCIEETSCEGNVIADNYCSSSIAPSDNDIRINWYFFIFIFIGLGLLAIILITKIRKK